MNDINLFSWIWLKSELGSIYITHSKEAVLKFYFLRIYFFWKEASTFNEMKFISFLISELLPSFRLLSTWKSFQDYLECMKDLKMVIKSCKYLVYDILNSLCSTMGVLCWITSMCLTEIFLTIANAKNKIRILLDSQRGYSPSKF